MAVVRSLITKWGFQVDDSPLRRMEGNIRGLKSTIRGMSFAFAGAAAGVSVFLREAGRFEQSTIAFETMLGSAEAAKTVLADLAQFAARTPFTLPGVEQNAKQLLAVGIETEKLIPTMKALGDISAGLSVPLERIALNFGQVKTQGKLTGRELRDFNIAGVPLAAQLAKQLGVAREEITSMVSKGKIGFAEVEKAFFDMTSGSGRFADLMTKQSKSFFGILSNIKDELILLARDIGEKLLPEAKALATQFRKWVSVNKELIKLKIDRFLKVAIFFIKGFATVMFKSAKFAAKLAKVVGGLENVLWGLSAAMLAFLSLQFLAFLGNAIMLLPILLTKIKFAIELLRVLGIQGAITWAGLAAGPVAVGLAFVALFLILEDFVAFLQGRKSVFGLLAKNFEAFSKSGGFFGDLFKEINMMLNPFQWLAEALILVVDAFEKYNEIKADFDTSRLGKFLNESKEKDKKNTVGGTGARGGGRFGFNQSFDSVPTPPPSGASKNDITINVNGAGNPQATADAVSVQLDQMLKNTSRQTRPAVAE